jgi:hypothetical protein
MYMAYVIENLVQCISRVLFKGYSTTTDAILLHRLEACSHLRVYGGYTVAWRNIGKQISNERASKHAEIKHDINTQSIYSPIDRPTTQKRCKL